ncbi:MAG TPA: glycosyltransferase family 9 protein [Planctomycetota bacterium]|nr:glycosyltransferase family 9 protein [Planctomycetota bacterium]
MKAALPEHARLLIRVPNWLGDLVMAEPVLRAADERGGATLVGPPRLLALFDGKLLNCDRLYADEPRGWRGHDAALLLTGSLRSALIAARAQIPVRAGLARDARGWLLTHSMRPAREAGRVPLSLGVHGRGARWLPRPFASVCVELASLVGLEVSSRRPRLLPSWPAREAVRLRLESQGLASERAFVAVNVGSRPHSAKGATPQLWSALLASFARQSDLPLVLVSGPGEDQALASVKARGLPASAIVLPGAPLDLPELCALFSLANLVVSADNGPRHVAAAAGTPVVVLCGPTDPRHTADHLQRVRILRASEPCSPCHREVCPLSGSSNLVCFQHIDPDLVARSMLELAQPL